MTKPHFHLVTPSFNQAHFIQETLDSLLQQKQVQLTVWVMDGGSSDKTVSLLKKYGKKINWISRKDRGQSDALNKGLKKILQQVPKKEYQTTYIGYLNSDDFLQSGSLAHVATIFASQPQTAWVVGECEIVNEKSQPIQSLIKLYKRFWRQLLSWQVLLVLNPLPQPAIFWRLSSTAKIGLFNQKLQYTMDYEYWLRLWQAFGSPHITNQMLAGFRIHGASKGSTSFVKQFQEQYLVASRFTRSRLLLLLQRLHNQTIFFCYKLLKP